MALIKLNRVGMCVVCWDQQNTEFVVVNSKTGKIIGSGSFPVACDIAGRYSEQHGMPMTEAYRILPEKQVAFAGTAAMCVHRGRFLIGVRGPGIGFEPGMLCFPGGSIDCGADHTDTAAEAEREFREETGLECSVVKGINCPNKEMIVTNCFFENEHASFHYLTCYMLAELTEKYQEIDINSTVPGAEPNKCAEWRWLTFRQILEALLSRQIQNPITAKTLQEIEPRKLQWMPVDKIAGRLSNIGIGWDGEH